MKIYLIGGDRKGGESIYEKAFSDAGNSPKILVFPWTREKEKKEYRIIVRDYFKKLGASEVIFANLSNSKPILTKKVNSSDVIILPGGAQDILIKNIKNKGVDKLLEKYEGVIVGNSAGALVMCDKYLMPEGQDYEPKTVLKAGLGFAKITIVVHYNSKVPKYSGRGEKEIIKFSKKTDIKIYAIPENCAIFYNDKNLEFMGDIYLFYKGKKRKLNL